MKVAGGREHISKIACIYTVLGHRLRQCVTNYAWVCPELGVKSLPNIHEPLRS